ncbi:MAG: PEP-CTERM sorting domain-containing protein [Verrucomicrobiales bacterium]|nr:PEP-CTERM sorting domain-containing protein [Verrucomicrobiales bacterium]
MKYLTIALTALLAAASAYAQGTVNFATRITGSVDARVTFDGAPAGSTIWGQLYSGTAALGNPVPFRDSPAAAQGYITSGGTVEVPGVASGGTASIKLVAWHSSLGATYAEAVAKGMNGTAESAAISVTVGGGTLPPGNLVGLAGFNVSSIVPEPSIAALGILGAGLLVLRRKK